MRRISCALVLLVALAGCETSPTDPVAEAPVLAAASAGPVAAIAKGSGHRVRNDRALVFTFNARRMADGSADGSYYLDWQDLGPALDHRRLQIEVDVTCMSVSGNRAWVAGIITSVDGPIARVGTVSYFYVTDNGEGEGVDEISSLRINDVAGEDRVFCEQQPALLGSVPIEHGNAQVKAF